MKRGFSLIELSIVIVILGLLTGGILAGRSLVRATELRSIATDITRYRTAVSAFRDKYFGLPGDITNATQIWGAIATPFSTCRTTSSAGSIATCDGNGDGVIESADGGTSYSERYRAWQQLANAGLVEGSFTGITNGGVYSSTPSLNVPQAKITGVGYSLMSSGSYPSDAAFFAGNYDNIMMIGMPLTLASTRTPFLMPEEMWNIDTKMDDGKPAFGGIRMVPLGSAYAPNCTTTASGATSDYQLNNTGQHCFIIAKIN